MCSKILTGKGFVRHPPDTVPLPLGGVGGSGDEEGTGDSGDGGSVDANFKIRSGGQLGKYISRHISICMLCMTIFILCLMHAPEGS